MENEEKCTSCDEDFSELFGRLFKATPEAGVLLDLARVACASVLGGEFAPGGLLGPRLVGVFRCSACARNYCPWCASTKLEGTCKCGSRLQLDASHPITGSFLCADVLRRDIASGDEGEVRRFAQKVVAMRSKGNGGQIKYRSGRFSFPFEVSCAAQALTWLGYGPFPSPPENKAQPAVPSTSEVACIAAGTRISLPDGEQVPVESITVGQSVLGYHDGHGRVVSARVTRVASHDPALVVRLSADKGELIATPRHRVFTKRGWTSARDLVLGEPIGACFPGVYGLGHARVRSITPVKEPQPVYNLYVEGACTYVANGLITHSYVVLPNLRTMLNRLHLALTRLSLFPQTRPALVCDVVSQIRAATR